MPDQPFDRTIYNPREKPLSEDMNIALSQVDRAIRFFAKTLFSNTGGSAVSGFVQGGFKAVESGPAAMSVVLKAGLGFQDLPGDTPGNIDGILGLDDFESYKPLPLLADLTVPIPTAPAGPSSRIDIIEVRADRLKTDSQSREVFDNDTVAFAPTAVDKTLEFLLDGANLGSVTSPADSVSAISLKQGIPGTPGVAPAATSGYIKIAEVFVDSSVTQIFTADITDTRQKLIKDLGAVSSARDILIPASAAIPVDIATYAAEFDFSHWQSIAASNFYLNVPISAYLKKGDRIISISFFVSDDTTNTVDGLLVEHAFPLPAGSVVSDLVPSDLSGSDVEVVLTNISFNGGTNIVDDKAISLEIIGNAAVAGLSFNGVKLSVDTP